MEKTVKYEVGQVFAVPIIAIDPKGIKYVDNSYGKWTNDYNWTIKEQVKTEFEKDLDFDKSYTLLKYIGDNQFEEYYTAGEVIIYLDDKYEYEHDTVDKYLFVSAKSLQGPNEELYTCLALQKEGIIHNYLKALQSRTKEDIECRINKKLEGDYISAVGQNLYFDYVRKRTK